MYSLMLLAKSIEGPMPQEIGGVSQLEIAAIIGGLLIVARVIVGITKTKKDDAMLNKVTGWLKIVRVITGLNVGGGIDKYKPK